MLGKLMLQGPAETTKLTAAATIAVLKSNEKTLCDSTIRRIRFDGAQNIRGRGKAVAITGLTALLQGCIAGTP